MLNKTKIYITITGLGLFLAITTNPVLAKKTIETKLTRQFQKIEQPLALKLMVLTGGLGLISAELWWFLFSKTKS